MEASKASLDTSRDAHGSDTTIASRIYDLIRGMRDSGAAAVGGRGGSSSELIMSRVRELVIAKGFTLDQLNSTIEEYSLLDVSFFSLL